MIYLRDKAHWGLKYSKLTEPCTLEVYVDSSLGNGKGRRSIFGFVIMINSCIVHYKSKLEPIVSLSSTESEFIALALSLKEVEWIMNLCDETKVITKKSIVWCDNQGALKIVQNKHSVGRTKHVDLKLQKMKEAVLKGEITPRYVRSEDNVADIFTKPLGRIAFEKLRNVLLVEVPDGAVAANRK